MLVGWIACWQIPDKGRQEVLHRVEGAEVANLNTPEQTVISGSVAGVAAASEALKAKGARIIPLQVSAPFHSSLMQPARVRLEKDLGITDFHEFYFPVIANVTATENTDSSAVPELLSQQVTGSVRWVESMQRLWDLGAREYIEFGSGTVLTGMIKKILPEAKTFNISSPEGLELYLRSRI